MSIHPTSRRGSLGTPVSAKLVHIFIRRLESETPVLIPALESPAPACHPLEVSGFDDEDGAFLCTRHIICGSHYFCAAPASLPRVT